MARRSKPFNLGGKTVDEIVQIVMGKDADKFVKGLLASGEAVVRPIGDRGENGGHIGMAADPLKAITELIGSNMADALSEKYIFEGGQAGNSPREMIERRSGLAGGRFERKSVSNKAVQAMLDEAEVHLRGHIGTGDTPSNLTIDARDRGVGVQYDRVASTLCGLGGGGKTYAWYFAGAWGQGGKACLVYANPEGEVCQLILTRHVASDEVTLTFVTRDRRRGIARTPIYNYLVDPTTQKPWKIKVGNGCTFDTGTMIRTFDYPVGVQGASKLGSATGSFDSMMRRTLPDPLNPVCIRDLRTASKTQKAWNSYLKSNRAVVKHLGSLHKLYNDRKVNFYREYGIELGVGSTAKMHVAVFDHSVDPSHLERYADFERPFILSLNGQTHGELSKHVLTKDVGFSALNKKFYAFIDMDDVNLEFKNNLFSSSRENARQSAELRLLKGKIVKALMSDPELEELNREYRDQNSSKSDSSEDDMVHQLINQHIQSLRTNYPNGARKTKTEREPREVVPLLPIPVSDPPTLFELQGDVSRDVVKGKTFRVRINTDAHPDLFGGLGTTFIVDTPYSYLTYESCTRNDGGRKSFVFSVDHTAPTDAKATITFLLDPPKGNPMSVSLEVNVKEPVVKPPEDEGLPFEVKNVDSEEFLDALEMCRDDVSVLKQEAGDRVIYINLLNPLFQSQIESFNEDGRFKSPEQVVTNFRAVYRAEAILTAWEVFVENEDSDADIDLMERLIRRGSKCAFSTLRRHVKTSEDLRRVLGRSLN